MGLKFAIVILLLLPIFAIVSSLVCMESGTITGKVQAKECDVSNLHTLDVNITIDIQDESNITMSYYDNLDTKNEAAAKKVEFRCFITSASREKRLSEMRGCTKKGGCETIKRRLMRAHLENIMCKECSMNMCNSAKKLLIFAPLLCIAGRLF
ncbi:hypothetical protein TcasGA2_TC033991 [Tribolium castaneum]|uniref:Uncharacterized protein n=1 Tax=Tribolium castaneum TaxID=7070 RepID=A0A139WE46_TRICA|nr:PREDICTED: uncharacterized protein LOC107398418 [Tribolium castaneum]KYB26137.1 hypothetical protein TcasGA2_TC033991 [Tribolium castaneum]|eukprot:XP_015837910.1 PREDICTED: uncharacterized protein LOC107398418 [Tribolium castaneum]